MVHGRALHFVFRVANRKETTKFYRDVLGMQILRHEEFGEGCKAACNGPFDGKWSKSMVGYGSEDTHFVIELTYNYLIGSYKLGTDFLGITIESPSIAEKAKKFGYPVTEEGDVSVVTSPDGYKFFIRNKTSEGDPVKKVSLAASDLDKSVDYWTRLCNMTLVKKDDKSAELIFEKGQCCLELVSIGKKVDHATAFGRIAFSCPHSELPDLEKKMRSENQTILNPLISLDTPGKATVQVVILADPDGHEICFVEDEGFRILSQRDANADALLDEAIAADNSDDWYSKKGMTKKAA